MLVRSHVGTTTMAAPMEKACFLTADEKTINPDDWLFDSIRMYSSLHMFELQHPAEVIEWIGEKHICVACCQPSGKSEILQLSLPDRLLSGDDPLQSGRDFAVVCGGFSDKKTTAIKHLPNSRCLVTSEEGDNALTVWETGDEDSGLIQKRSKMSNLKPNITPARLAVLDAGTDNVAFGTALNDVCVADVESAEIIFSSKDVTFKQDPSEDRCTIDEFLPAGPLCFFAALRNGSIWHFDMRETSKQPTHTIQQPPDGTSVWTFDAATTGTGSYDIVQVSSGGQVKSWDLRGTTKACSEGKIGIRQHGEAGTMKVQWSKDGKEFSVSGFDNKVSIYTKGGLRDGGTAGKTLNPTFTHRGHEACAEVTTSVMTLTHTWHPSIPQSVLSTASDGSLHAWQYIVQSS